MYFEKNEQIAVMALPPLANEHRGDHLHSESAVAGSKI